MKVWHYSLFFCFHKTDKRKDKKKETFLLFFKQPGKFLMSMMVTRVDKGFASLLRSGIELFPFPQQNYAIASMFNYHLQYYFQNNGSLPMQISSKNCDDHIQKVFKNRVIAQDFAGRSGRSCYQIIHLVTQPHKSHSSILLIVYLH